MLTNSGEGDIIKKEVKELSKRKKLTLLIVSLLMLATLVLIILTASPKAVYKELSANGRFEVAIKSSDFLQPGGMGGREYTLNVYEKSGLLKQKIFSETFWFNNDGAPISDNNISVDWKSEYVTVIIDSEEMNVKEYTILTT